MKTASGIILLAYAYIFSRFFFYYCADSCAVLSNTWKFSVENSSDKCHWQSFIIIAYFHLDRYSSHIQQDERNFCVMCRPSIHLRNRRVDFCVWWKWFLCRYEYNEEMNRQFAKCLVNMWKCHWKSTKKMYLLWKISARGLYSFHRDSHSYTLSLAWEWCVHYVGHFMYLQRNINVLVDFLAMTAFCQWLVRYEMCIEVNRAVGEHQTILCGIPLNMLET